MGQLPFVTTGVPYQPIWSTRTPSGDQLVARYTYRPAALCDGG
jgi:hypothetical protein